MERSASAVTDTPATTPRTDTVVPSDAGGTSRAAFPVMADYQVDQEVALKRAAPFGRLRKPRTHQPRGQILVPSPPGPSGRHAHRFPTVPWRVRFREEWAGLTPRVEPPLKARVGLADIVQRRGTLNHFQKIVGQANPLPQHPCPGPDRVTMPVQFHGDRTERQLVKLIAHRFASGLLDGQARYLVPRFENAPVQPTDESGPLRSLPPRRRRRVPERRKDVRNRFGPFLLVDVAVVVGQPQCHVDEPTEFRAAKSPDRNRIERQSQVGERGVRNRVRSGGIPPKLIHVSRVARDDDTVPGAQVAGGNLLDRDAVRRQPAHRGVPENFARLRQRHVDGLAIRTPRP